MPGAMTSCSRCARSRYRLYTVFQHASRCRPACSQRERPTCKENLFKWLSTTVDELNKNKQGVAHCWETTRLLRAWDREVQVEAAAKLAQLFPNLNAVGGTVVSIVSAQAVRDDAVEEDVEACYAGAGLAQVEDDEEWEAWVDWSVLASEAGPSGA